MKKNSLLSNNDLRCMLKIVRISEKMIRNGKKYKFTNSEFQELIYIMNCYLNLYGKVQEYERDREK